MDKTNISFIVYSSQFSQTCKRIKEPFIKLQFYNLQDKDPMLIFRSLAKNYTGEKLFIKNL